MTSESTTPGRGENTEDHARRGLKRLGFRAGRRARMTAAAVLLPAIAAAALLSSADTASATTTPLSTYPTSECYANGTVIADKPTVNSNGQYVVFTPVFYIWNNGAWTVAGWGPIQAGTEPYEGDIGTWIAVSPVTFHGLPHHYYEVVDDISNSAVTLKYLTQPMVGHVGSSSYCYTG
jgi:hypothetical protein